jgi:hypothetical protein
VSPPAVQWRFDPATTRPLRLLVYAAVGLAVGPLVGFVALLSTTLAAGGGAGVALVAIVLALVVGLGVGSGRMLFTLASDDVPTPLHGDTGALSRRWLVGSVLVGATLEYATFLLTDLGLCLLVGSAVTGFCLLVVGAGLQSEGAVDPDAGTIEYGGDAIPLGAVRRVRSLRFGRFVLAVVGYHAGRVGPSTPRLLVLSAEALEALDSSRTSHASDRDRGGTRPVPTATPTATRAVAAAFGLACLAAGPILWLALPPDGGRLVAVYLGVFGLFFGGLFLRYAVVS